MSSGIDNHEFCLQTKNFEKQAYDNAIQKALVLIRDNPKLKARRATRSLCDEAFKSFAQNLENAFPDENYKNLINLTQFYCRILSA